jgi:hypothetical protein
LDSNSTTKDDKDDEGGRVFMKYNYYWYHHNAMSMKRQHWIDKKIMEHDWEAFLLVKEMYDADDSKYKISTKGTPMTYFPDTIQVINPDGTQDHIKMNAENMKLITHCESENG